MHAPTKRHMEVANQILRDLKGSPGKGLPFKKNKIRDVGFSEADWARGVDDNKCTNGYRTNVWENLVTWRSKK